MSIYATWLSLDQEHEHGCAQWVQEEIEGCYYLDRAKPCTCGLPRSPFVYQGSHVLPAEDDDKGGSVLVCGIPDHITRDGRDDAPEGALKDWLRLSLYPANDKNAVVLARRHVEELRDTLTAWLDRESTYRFPSGEAAVAWLLDEPASSPTEGGEDGE